MNVHEGSFTRSATVGLSLVMASCLVACGSGRRSEPVIGPLQLSTREEVHGEIAFMKHCNSCHPGGDAGLGPAINHKPLPAAMIHLQVRQGLGGMPSFPATMVSNEDIRAIHAYLAAVRHHGG